jgi:hypothetical protein
MAEYCLTSYTNKHNAATRFVAMEMMQDHLLLHIAAIFFYLAGCTMFPHLPAPI